MGAFEELDKRLAPSREAFLATFYDHEKRAPLLEQHCVKHLNQYATDVSRADHIRRAADDAIRQLKPFRSEAISIFSDVGLVNMSLRAIPGLIALEITADHIRAIETGAILEKDVYVARAQAAVDLAAQSMDLAALIFSLHLRGLSRYLGEDDRPGAAALAEALIRVASRKGPGVIVDKLIELAVPGLAPLKEALEFMAEVRTELYQHEPIYSGRNDVDDLYDFSDWLKQQNAVALGIKKTMGSACDALVAMGRANHS